ncbi:peptidase domain-containing ABC transporter [Emcibacter sp.]|uniref:peptidase domain-containing ABC transporter n=1 Tax=Emcibacter sp. TaxID=1979954 RepID=UPI002AA94EAF|nr:peptidase domain-containing ABC transporter [Emcibacter sp.]
MNRDTATDAPVSSGTCNKGPAREMIEELNDKFRDGASLKVAKADQLADALQAGKIGSFHASSDYAACLLPLLQALGWRGQLRRLFESLPHFADGLELTEFRNTLAHLHYKTDPVEVDLASVDPRLFPCLFVENNRPLVVLSRDREGIRYFDSSDQQEKYTDGKQRTGTAYFISTKHASQTNKLEDDLAPKNWVKDLFLRFKGTIKQMFAMTLMLNFFALLVPLFIMAIYDQVIPSQSGVSLSYLVAGITLALGCEVGLRILRARQTAYLGARVENIVANATFQKLLSLSPMMTESAPIGSQVSRLKEFDAIKGLFTSTLVNVFLELPFVVLFLALIAILGGTLAYIPIAMMGIFALVAAIMIPAMKRNVASTSRARARRHSFLVEALSNLRTIKQTAAEKPWLQRYRTLSAETAYNHFRSSQVSLLLQSLAQAIMMGSGVATVGFGVLKVMNGDMTIGALIACMALVWRVLSPLQSLFLTLSRLEQTLNSIKQINQLMRIPSEDDLLPNSLTQRTFAGNLVMDRTSFRYKPDSEPALLGAGFRLNAGEMMAIMGPNAAGKSTVLKLIIAMHKPQAGQIILDGMDIRQINPAILRQSIAYVPQQSHFFHGTIAQNLRLAQPMASQPDLEEACLKANVLEEINNLPEGFETRIGDQSIQSLPSSFMQRLSLARAFLKKASILLLDEPAKTLDFEGDRAFMNTLAALKGTCTIIMVSHRPSHLKMADKVLVLEEGLVKNFGPPESVFPAPAPQTA